MTVDELLEEARSIWGDEPQSIDRVAVLMGVVYGDLCRQARNSLEGKAIDDHEVKKEMGNIIFSTIRWCNELGYNPTECIELAKQAQKQYANGKANLPDPS